MSLLNGMKTKEKTVVFDKSESFDLVFDHYDYGLNGYKTALFNIQQHHSAYQVAHGQRLNIHI